MPNIIAYRIKDWEDTYENNRTRDLRHMRWVPIPNSFDGDRISELIERGGCDAYAACVPACLPQEGATLAALSCGRVVDPMMRGHFRPKHAYLRHASRP